MNQVSEDNIFKENLVPSQKGFRPWTKDDEALLGLKEDNLEKAYPSSLGKRAFCEADKLS